MSQTLDEFLKEVKKEIIVFENIWREKNAQNSEQYPMEMIDGNEGLWWEFFHNNDII